MVGQGLGVLLMRVFIAMKNRHFWVRAPKLNTMHTWGLSDALWMGRHGASQGYTSREVWADYEGSTWSQLRARNAEVL